MIMTRYSDASPRCLARCRGCATLSADWEGRHRFKFKTGCFLFLLRIQSAGYFPCLHNANMLASLRQSKVSGKLVADAADCSSEAGRGAKL